MSRARYKADNSLSGMGGFLRKDKRLQTAALVVANGGKAHAESIAPVDSGEYAESFHVSDESGRPDSVGATLYNDAGHAAVVEYERSGTLAQTTDYLNAKMSRRG